MDVPMVFRTYPSLVLRTGLIVLSCVFLVAAQGQSQQSPAIPSPKNGQPEPKIEGRSSASLRNAPDPSQRLPGFIGGIVVDQTGAAVAGAEVKLTREPPAQ